MKKIIIIGVIGVTLLLSACSKSNGKENDTKEYIGQTFDTISESDLGSYKEELLDLNAKLNQIKKA